MSQEKEAVHLRAQRAEGRKRRKKAETPVHFVVFSLDLVEFLATANQGTETAEPIKITQKWKKLESTVRDERKECELSNGISGTSPNSSVFPLGAGVCG